MKKVNIKNIKIKLSIGEIVLVLPSKWGLDQYHKILNKLELPQKSVLIYTIYYSQVDANKILLKDLKNLSNNETRKTILTLINSDMALLNEFNNNQNVNNINEAHKLLKNFIKYTLNKLGSLFISIFFVCSLFHNFISSLRGELELKDIKILKGLLKCLLQLKKEHPEYFTEIEYHLKELENFDSHKEKLLMDWVNFSFLIKQINKADMWIPSRYASKFFNKLNSIDFINFNKKQIEKVILEYFDLNLGYKILEDWKKSSLFKGREQIIQEAFQTHNSNLFAPAITCFLPQLDFVVFEIGKHLKINCRSRNTDRKLLREICTYIEDNIIGLSDIHKFITKNGDIGKSVYLFQLKSLVLYLKDIVFQDTSNLKSESLSRHGISHGKFLDYPNKNNSKKLILLIDDLVTFYHKLPDYLKSDK